MSVSSLIRRDALDKAAADKDLTRDSACCSLRLTPNVESAVFSNPVTLAFFFLLSQRELLLFMSMLIFHVVLVSGIKCMKNECGGNYSQIMRVNIMSQNPPFSFEPKS